MCKAGGLKRYSPHTENTRVDQVRRFISPHSKRRPNEMGAPEGAAFLTHLTINEHIAARPEPAPF